MKDWECFTLKTVTVPLKVLLQEQVRLSHLTFLTILRSDASTSGCHNRQRIPYQRKAAVWWASLSIPLNLDVQLSASL